MSKPESFASDSALSALRPRALAEAVGVMYDLNRPIFIEGGVGVGKTSIVKQVAHRRGWTGAACIHMHAPTKQAEDYGIPWPMRAGESASDLPTFSFLIPEGLPVVGSATPPEGVLLLDELPQASPDIQKVLANLIHEREIHGHRLKPGWRVAATGNRVQDRAGAGRVLSHLRNRMTTLALESSHKDWEIWAAEAGVHERVRAYMHARAGTPLMDFDPARDLNATPRAWAEGVSPLLGRGLGGEILRAAIGGAVGPGHAVEFLAFLEVYGLLPTREEFIAKPEETVAGLPKEKGASQPKADLLYALATMLTVDLSAEAFGPAIRAAMALPEEFASLVFLTFFQRNPTEVTTRAQSDVKEVLKHWGHLIR